MKVTAKNFEEFDTSLSSVIAYLQDCQKACKELRKSYLQDGEIPDDFFSIDYTISDAAIKRTCKQFLGKEPVKIEKIGCRKIVTVIA